MNVNIDNKLVEDILKRSGYVIETAEFYYDSRTDLYPTDLPKDSLSKLYYKVAYHVSETPKWKEEEYPLIEEYSEYKYDAVAERVVGNLIGNLILNSI